MEPVFIDIHTHSLKNSENLIQIVNLDLEFPCCGQSYFSYGIHPWEMGKAGFQVELALNLLEEQLKSPGVVALGEAGLDKMHKDSFERQITIFERQIALSESLYLPMILHDVKSHSEIMSLRKKHKATQPWILHGFNGTVQDIQQLTRQGLCLSVGESLLHPERKICKSLKSIPLDLLFFETDWAEIDIETIYQAAARLLEIDMVDLKRHIFANFAQLFRRSTHYSVDAIDTVTPNVFLL